MSKNICVVANRHSQRMVCKWKEIQRGENCLHCVHKKHDPELKLWNALRTLKRWKIVQMLLHVVTVVVAHTLSVVKSRNAFVDEETQVHVRHGVEMVRQETERPNEVAWKCVFQLEFC